MNNSELYLKFIEIASYNPFDAYIKLKEFKKEYKKSEFYKATRMSWRRAYKLFLQMMPSQLLAKLKEFTDVDMLATKLTDLINSVDEDAINGFFEKLTNIFNLEKLQDEKGDLKILLNQVKDLVQ
jgi:hypothetical protein